VAQDDCVEARYGDFRCWLEVACSSQEARIQNTTSEQ
jgi:hypothetical protein